MKTQSKKKWTVAVYMAGDNDLDSNAYLDLKEMKRVGSTMDINIVAQLDSASSGSKTTRYEAWQLASFLSRSRALQGSGQSFALQDNAPGFNVDYPLNTVSGNRPIRQASCYRPTGMSERFGSRISPPTPMRCLDCWR